MNFRLYSIFIIFNEPLLHSEPLKVCTFVSSSRTQYLRRATVARLNSAEAVMDPVKQ